MATFDKDGDGFVGKHELITFVASLIGETVPDDAPELKPSEEYIAAKRKRKAQNQEATKQ